MTDAEIEIADLRAQLNSDDETIERLQLDYAALRAEAERLDQQGEDMTRDRDAWRETAYEREREAENLRAEVERVTGEFAECFRTRVALVEAAHRHEQRYLNAMQEILRLRRAAMYWQQLAADAGLHGDMAWAVWE